MKKTIVPFAQVPQLAKTDVAYATGDPKLQAFFAYPPRLDSFDEVIQHQQKRVYPRNDLADVLSEQYAPLSPKPAVQANITALRSSDTFTVTTAHQPSLFTGPLYFIYKALTTIQLAETLTASAPEGRRIVPIFVLGSEDHDLEELNNASVFGKKIVWLPESKGAVGDISAATVQQALQELKDILGNGEPAQVLYKRVEEAYSAGRSFAGATQALLHDLLGEFGLVVLNMNTPVLKRHFIPVMRQELMEQPSFRIVNDTIAQLNEKGFKTQAAPREINLFYMIPGLRERIVREGDSFKVLNTTYVFSLQEMAQELEAHPERFSPNVVLRPIFQELILPNLAYIGGGGELAYWMERKPLFEYFGVHFPLLVRRHSILWLDKDVVKKLDKFGCHIIDFFGDTDALVRNYIEKNATGEVSLSPEIRELHDLYNKLTLKASAIDPTLEKAVRAEEVKVAAGFEQWESRLMRAEKQKHEVAINQLRGLKEKLFPANGLQERSDNILPYLLKHGDGFLADIKSELQPFETGFVVLQSDEDQ